MDRRQARAHFLIAAALPLLLTAAADVPNLPIREARWLAPGQLFDGLTRQPAECFTPPKLPSDRASAAIGRAAFRAPLLLGGQAARVGLSCASCHRNGRGNMDFAFPSLSGHPGTADVTSSLMSKKRGDGAFNPKAIPDLAGANLKISRDPAKPDLKTFIHGLVVDEFDGEEPPPAVLDGLTAYVRALSPAACRGPATVAIRIDGMLNDADAAMRSAEYSWRAGDVATARVLVGAARSTLGSIDERFQLPGLDRGRAILHAADVQLRAIQQAPSKVAYRKWHRDWPHRKVELRKQEARSLFNPVVLRRRLVEVRP
ncbi:hypothetical protein [Sphingomonas sp.]|uniref:hypothetical protein n=1 Tax=Sphingomonas sp. TaxID=28214 RepID=UPI00286A278B|nr:hypothetical protein [Sphingomonas sp.]